MYKIQIVTIKELLYLNIVILQNQWKILRVRLNLMGETDFQIENISQQLPVHQMNLKMISTNTYW